MLIAECGNSHMGSIDKAKLLIKAAHDSGATICKMQLGVMCGSMPKEFYFQCHFGDDNALELIDYARDIGSDLFFSIFNEYYTSVRKYQRYLKIAAPQSLNKFEDKDTTIVSVKINKRMPSLKRAQVLHVSEYMTDFPNLHVIKTLERIYKRPIGYSDHTIGTKWAIKSIIEYGANVVEKHFTLKHNEMWQGKLWRDSVFSATPDEFEKIAKEMK